MTPYLLGAPFVMPAPAGSLAGLQWLLPKTGTFAGPPEVWTCPTTATASAIMSGAPGRSYDVALRFVGVVEAKTYTGGTNDGAFWQIGGTPASDNWNVYKLTISSPAQTYYLNRGTSGLFVCNAIDYTKTIQIDQGATVTLSADSIDGKEIEHALSAPGVTNPAQPYAGQFIDMFVQSVALH